MGRRFEDFDKMTPDAQVDLASVMNLNSEGANMFPPDVVERVENLRREAGNVLRANALLNHVSEGYFE